MLITLEYKLRGAFCAVLGLIYGFLNDFKRTLRCFVRGYTNRAFYGSVGHSLSSSYHLKLSWYAVVIKLKRYAAR